MNETKVRRYAQGKLAIDIYDVKTHQPVWHGWAVKRIKTEDQDNTNQAIRTVVEQIVATF